MTITDLLVDRARTHPDTIALIDDRAGCRLTYADLEREVGRSAGWLQSQGLKRGDAVLVFVPMSADLYVAVLAMFRLGVVTLFLDPSAGRAHLERCCARWAPAALLAIPRAHLMRVFSSALRRIPRKIVMGGWAPATRRWLGGPAANPVEERSVGGTDPALVTFTSGSTGVPKAAVRTHDFLLAQYRALAPNITLRSGDVDLATLPVFTLANLAAGITTVLADLDLRHPGRVDAAAVFDAVARHKVTRMTASPAFFERLAEHGNRTGCQLATLTQIHTGGAPVFPRLLDALQALAPNAHVVAVYGSTEAEPIAHIAATGISASDQRAMRSGRGLLAGAPVEGIQIRVLTDRWGTSRPPTSRLELDRETVPAGTPGEIVVSGAHVLQGYLGGVGDAETKFSVEGTVWHRTGDAGLLDETGRLWLLGRCSAKIEDSRGTMYPFGVECAAMCFPEVRRAAAVRHDVRRILVLEADSPREVLSGRVLAAVEWAHIDRVRVVPSLPVDSRHNSKTDYVRLAEMLAAPD